MFFPAPASSVSAPRTAEKIHGSIEGDFIVFRKQRRFSDKSQKTRSEKSCDFSKADQLNFVKLQDGVQEQLDNMTPNQKEQIRKMAENLTADEKAKIMKLFSQMNPPKKPFT